MKSGFKHLFTHFFVLTFFALAALAYFYPVLQGQALYQSDIVQYRGMAQEQEEFRREFKEEPYWTNSAFGGMPTYQLGARYPHDYIKQLDHLIRFLPRPADYLFLYFLSFYILMCCMKVGWRMAVFGALAFGFSAYLIIIFGAGHNAKAHALGYLPMVMAGIILVFRKKYIWGFLLTALAMALEIQANHYQMTYYFGLLVVILGVAYLIDAIRKGVLKHYFVSVGLLILAVALGVVTNATALLATQEYAAWSTRGPSALTLDPEGNPKEATTGLDFDYITQYSYGITESLNIWAARLFGGGSIESLGEDSHTYEYLIDQGVPRSQALEFSNNLQLYWGEQPGVAGPAYVGAIVLLLFVMGFFLVRGRPKWWLVGGFVLSLLLSWGKNLGWFTQLMIDYVPLYDKFRAVSSAQVILEFCAPVLAVLALWHFFSPNVSDRRKQKALLISAGSFLALGLVLLLFKSAFSFEGTSDGLLKQYYPEDLVAMIVRDREAVYVADILRSMLFTLLTTGVLWFHLKGKLRENLALIALGTLLVFDLVGIDRRYINADDFVPERRMNAPIVRSAADQAILRDSSVYRVFNIEEGPNGARTSYFHQSLGGYHAAKPGRMQDLFQYHIYRNNRQVLSMLNTKYLIRSDENGSPTVSMNPDAMGNAWFVRSLQAVPDADAAILALDTLAVAQSAIFNSSDFPDVQPRKFELDSLAEIELEVYQPNRLRYQLKNNNEGLAVFSEMYYPNGWNAYLDGEKVPHFRVNYALRAMEVPAGIHWVEFRFEPEVITQGSKYVLAGSVALLLLFLTAIGREFLLWRRGKLKAEQ
ncbi:hypothetical protein SAMN04490243_1760 [Robiginitalea myxolifaciens]|uniref:Membrane protein YfhO n=1 Tax=Robiginitalea myxolifaciens TaxID=400055 RepID=A0A1I6GVA9_9FLAO|nr:hypothetical protein [Robiginitalea myxolifaciens]SFR45997.1 hypothetical protein SAMN04490243_1760 [Robiginitalea myxolifaciens]